MDISSMAPLFSSMAPLLMDISSMAPLFPRRRSFQENKEKVWQMKFSFHELA
jgi:hypothetical protein